MIGEKGFLAWSGSVYLSGHGEVLSHLEGALSGAAAPLHGEESAEVAWASLFVALQTPPRGGVLGTSHREKPPAQTQDT